MRDGRFPTRRDWLRLVGAGTASLAIGCGDNTVGDAAVAAIFEPTSAGFTVAVWAKRARTATIVIAGDGAMMTTYPIVLGEGGCGALHLDGLDAATAYEVVVMVDGGIVGPHRVHTAPADDDRRAVRIAVAADVDPSPEFDTDLADHVVAAQPDLLVTIGDFPYTDNGPPAQTLETYRERHVETRTMPRVRTLLEAMPLCAIYDDHEFRNDWDTARATAEADRYAAAMTAWDEFFPLPGAIGDIRYRSWRWGAHVEGFMLDCRRFRSPNDHDDTDLKTMLGAEQQAWLRAALVRSTATFKLVFTSVPLDFGPADTWAGFRVARQFLFDAIVDVPGVLFVSADQHYFGAFRHAFGIREMQIGPLARGLGAFGDTGPGVLYRAQRFNVGLIDVASDHLTITGLGEGGDRFYEETLSIDDLTPRRV